MLGRFLKSAHGPRNHGVLLAVGTVLAASPVWAQTASEEGAETDPNYHGAYSSPTTPDDELADAPPAAEQDTTGLSVDLVGGFNLVPSSTHEWSDNTNCPTATFPAPTVTDPTATQTWAPGCSSTIPVGFLVDVRLGYSFGWVGLDVFGLGAGDWSSGSLSELPPFPVPEYATQMHIGRIGGAIGGNVRFKTPPALLRLNIGAGAGAMFRHVYSNVSSLDGSSVGYTAPIIRADAGLILLNFLTVGLMGWMEFAPTVTVAPDFSQVGLPQPVADALAQAFGDVTVFRGRQLFLGLFAGLHFGK